MAKRGDTFNIIEEQLKRARAKREAPPAGDVETARVMKGLTDPAPGLERLTSSLAKLTKSLSQGGKKASAKYGASGPKVRGGLSSSDMAVLKRERTRAGKERGVVRARAGGLLKKTKGGNPRGDGIGRRSAPSRSPRDTDHWRTSAPHVAPGASPRLSRKSGSGERQKPRPGLPGKRTSEKRGPVGSVYWLSRNASAGER